jgi:hypothetical protein
MRPRGRPGAWHNDSAPPPVSRPPVTRALSSRAPFPEPQFPIQRRPGDGSARVNARQLQTAPVDKYGIQFAFWAARLRQHARGDDHSL